LLVISIAFYVFDYLYIVFTKRYYWWFFLCDIVFLLTLYVTVIAIDVDNPSSLPHNKVILLCFFIFLLFYLAWDGSEYLTLPRGNERDFYRLSSVLGIALAVRYWCLRDNSLLWSNQFMISVATTVILSIMTIWFGFLVSRMRKFN